jgi:hypothetical protein
MTTLKEQVELFKKEQNSSADAIIQYLDSASFTRVGGQDVAYVDIPRKMFSPINALHDSVVKNWAYRQGASYTSYSLTPKDFYTLYFRLGH